MFVRAETGLGWWLRKMEARILGRAAGAVTVQRLNEYLGEELVYGPYEVCSLEAVLPDTFVGLDRATQAEINATLPHVSWRVAAVAPDGRRIVGQSVVFEACDESDPRGAALLITDEATGEILRWEPLGYREDTQGREYPAWTLFIHAKSDDELFSYSACVECGARTFLYYDVTRRRVYSEYNGH